MAWVGVDGCKGYSEKTTLRRWNLSKDLKEVREANHADTWGTGSAKVLRACLVGSGHIKEVSVPGLSERNGSKRCDVWGLVDHRKDLGF